MIRLLGKHRVRSSFYHLVACTFLVAMSLWTVGVISDKTNMWISVVLFITDYLAEMYDPNPEAEGPWFKLHFHRFTEDED